VGLGFVETADGVAEESDDFLLCAAAEAFGHIGHGGFGRLVDLNDEALVAREGRVLGEVKDLFGPLAGALPEVELSERASCGHAVLGIEYGVRIQIGPVSAGFFT
jgi:hypothetical protein